MPPREYAYTTVSILQKWALDKKLKFVPVPTFLSDFALLRFLNVWNSQTVTIDKPDDMEALLYSELLVARKYIVDNCHGVVRLGQVVDQLRPMLNPGWLDLYNQHKRAKLMVQSLEILCDEYGLKNANSYTDIVGALA